LIGCKFATQKFYCIFSSLKFTTFQQENICSNIHWIHLEPLSLDDCGTILSPLTEKLNENVKKMVSILIGEIDGHPRSLQAIYNAITKKQDFEDLSHFRSFVMEEMKNLSLGYPVDITQLRAICEGKYVQAKTLIGNDKAEELVANGIFFV